MTKIVYIKLDTLQHLSIDKINVLIDEKTKFVVYGYTARLYTIGEINDSLNKLFGIQNACIGRCPVFQPVNNTMSNVSLDSVICKQSIMMPATELPLGFVINWHLTNVIDKIYDDYEYVIICDESKIDELLLKQLLLSLLH